MLSAVIPTLNAAETLPQTLSALVPGAVEGVLADVVVSDGGSADATLAVADAAGCEIVRGERGRGGQLARGAAMARQPWLLFLHADTVLSEGWWREAAAFMERVDRAGGDAAAVFTFALDHPSWKARVLEQAVAARVAALALPYGDQGLLVPRRLYEEVGGYASMPLMEDVDLVRRIGRKRLHVLRARALTSAVRYERGFLRRVARNAGCLTLYAAGVSPHRIAQLYD